ncbi:MAG: hypothetical protein ACK50Z_06085 [Betaproteobacteria bacterium]|jgi:hypothetical protein
MRNAVLTVLLLLAHATVALANTPTGHEWLIDEEADLAEASALIRISYDYERNGREAVRAVFREKGYGSEYMSVSIPLQGSSELYLLASKKSQAVIVLWLGTNEIKDWVTNFKGTNYRDKPSAMSPGTPYIPPGHAGFRAHLLEYRKLGFFQNKLPSFAATFGLSRTGEQLPIISIGHSQGAGLSQFAIAAFDGYVHTGTGVSKRPESPTVLRKEIRFASPRALSSVVDGVSQVQCALGGGGVVYFDHLSLYRTTFSSNRRSISVINEDDMVPRIWNPVCGHLVPAAHYGTIVRLGVDGKRDEYIESIDSSQPHHIDTYIERIQRTRK